MKWLIDALASLIFSILMAVFVNVSKVLITPISMNAALFDSIRNLPFMQVFISALQVLGACIAVSITLISLKDTLKGPAGRSDPPLVLALKLMFTLAGIILSVPIGSYLISFVAVPYQSVQAISNSLFGSSSETWEAFAKAFTGIFTSLTKINDPVTTALNVLTYGLYSLTDINGIVNNIIAICVLIPVGFELISLCFDVFKRYVFMYMYIYFSPLAVSTIASSKTSPIFKKYCEQVISNILLTFLNVLMLALVFKAGTTILDPKTFKDMISPTDIKNVAPLLQIAVFWGVVRFAQTIDRNLGQLITVPSAGEGMGREMMAIRHGINTGLRAARTGRSIAQDIKGGKLGIGGKEKIGEIGKKDKKRYSGDTAGNKLRALGTEIAPANSQDEKVQKALNLLKNPGASEGQIRSALNAIDTSKLTDKDRQNLLKAMNGNEKVLDNFRTLETDKNGILNNPDGSTRYKTLDQPKDKALGQTVATILGKDGRAEFKKIPGIQSVDPKLGGKGDFTGKVLVNNHGELYGAEMIGKNSGGKMVNATAFFDENPNSQTRIGKNISINPYTDFDESKIAANQVMLNKFYQDMTGRNDFGDNFTEDFANDLTFKKSFIEAANSTSFGDGNVIEIKESSRLDVDPDKGCFGVYGRHNEKIYEIYPASKDHKANTEINGVPSYVELFIKNKKKK